MASLCLPWSSVSPASYSYTQCRDFPLSAGASHHDCIFTESFGAHFVARALNVRKCIFASFSEIGG